MSNDAVQRLLDERDIVRALYNASRAMDDRDWSTLADAFTEDATGDLGTGLLVGKGAVIALIRGYLDACGPTQHLLTNVIVDVTGETATSRAYVHDLHLATEDSARFYTLGDYRDRWVRRADRWQIIERVKINRAYVGPLETVFEGHPD